MPCRKRAKTGNLLKRGMAHLGFVLVQIIDRCGWTDRWGEEGGQSPDFGGGNWAEDLERGVQGSIGPLGANCGTD